MGSATLEKRTRTPSRKQGIIPYLTYEDIINVGKNSSNEESPINLSFDIMQEVKIPALEWENFQTPPKLMKISNSGTTAILSAKWNAPRPFISNGPISGKYVFSQLHFHWGRTFQEGSEHRINGESLPLEVHAMFFKHVYVSQEDAMKRNDGNITIAYFFKLQNEDNEQLKPITDVLDSIRAPMSSEHISCRPLEEFVPPFTEDYFLYWGKVVNMNVLWLICRKPLGISHNQLSSFQKLIGMDKKPIQKNFRELSELNKRKVFHVNPSANKEHPLLPVNSERNRTRSGTPKEEFCTVLENEPARREMVRGLLQEGEMNLLESDINKEKEEDGDNKSIYGPDIVKFHLKKNANVSELKYALAKALLELEKNENNDYGVLENYLKSKQAAAQSRIRKAASQSNDSVAEEGLKKSVKENEDCNAQTKTVYENSVVEVRIPNKESGMRGFKDKLLSEYETGESVAEDATNQHAELEENLSMSSEKLMPLVEEIYENVKQDSINPSGIIVTTDESNNSADSMSTSGHDDHLGDKVIRKTVVLTDKKELQKTFTVIGTEEGSDREINTDEMMSNGSEPLTPKTPEEIVVIQAPRGKMHSQYKEKITRIRRKLNSARQADRLPALQDGKAEFQAVQPRTTSSPMHKTKHLVSKRSKSSVRQKTPEKEQRLFSPAKNERKLQGRVDLERRREAIRRSLSRITRQMTPKETTIKRLSTAERPTWKP